MKAFFSCRVTKFRYFCLATTVFQRLLQPPTCLRQKPSFPLAPSSWQIAALYAVPAQLPGLHVQSNKSVLTVPNDTSRQVPQTTSVDATKMLLPRRRPAKSCTRWQLRLLGPSVVSLHSAPPREWCRWQNRRSLEHIELL